MSVDRYRYRLARAAWDWMEAKWDRFKGRRKERVFGRSEKRGARQEDRREVEREDEPPQPVTVCSTCGAKLWRAMRPFGVVRGWWCLNCGKAEEP